VKEGNMFKCWLLNNKVNAYAMDELDEKYTEVVERHLEKCLRCRKQVAEIKKITSAVSKQDKPFLGEVFWRKFDERLDLMLSGEATQRKWPVKRVVLGPVRKTALAAAMAVCILLVFFLTPIKDNFLKKTNIKLAYTEFVETVLLVEDAAELDLGNDEDSYVEEVLLQLELQGA
jgi:hypothetical protein